METLASWSRFVTRRAHAPPLVFLNGVCHPVKTGVYCLPHSHRAIEIVYHPRGRGITRMDRNRSHTFAEGDAVVYAPGEVHDQMVERDGEDLCVTLALPRGRIALPRHGFCVPAMEDSSVIEEIRTLSRGRARPDPAEQAIFNLRATSALYALVRLACLRREEDADDSAQRHVFKAEQYLREHFARIKSLSEVAGHVGIGDDHLRHVFKALRGVSLVRYLNQVRMDRAKTLLIHSRLPLKQVAAMCGFADEYYFSAVFRRVTQTPPGRYRTRLVQEA